MNNSHLMETTAAGARCSRCLRTPAELAGRSKSCPGKPWYVRYSAPKHLQTKSQLHQQGLRVTGPVVGYVVNAYGTLVKLYDLAETAPRRGESEQQREARLTTWEKTREKWRCRECGEIPASIGDLRNHWEKPGLCEGCAIMVEEQEHRDRLERDRHAASIWAADLFADPTSWALLDSETSDLKGVVLEVAIIDAAGSKLGEISTTFEVKWTKSARSVEMGYLESGETASHLVSALAILLIKSALMVHASQRMVSDRLFSPNIQYFERALRLFPPLWLMVAFVSSSKRTHSLKYKYLRECRVKSHYIFFVHIACDMLRYID